MRYSDILGSRYVLRYSDIDNPDGPRRFKLAVGKYERERQVPGRNTHADRSKCNERRQFDGEAARVPPSVS